MLVSRKDVFLQQKEGEKDKQQLPPRTEQTVFSKEVNGMFVLQGGAGTRWNFAKPDSAVLEHSLWISVQTAKEIKCVFILESK